MLTQQAAIALTMAVLGCASSSGQGKTAADVESSEAEAPEAEEQEQQDSGGPSSWSEVEPNTSSEQRPSRVSKKYAYIDVKSDPESHGPELTFHFDVNGLPIDGVFVAAGGQITNFRIPSGTISYTNDECSAGGGGFEIQPGARVTLACAMTTDGDCCEPRIEDEPKGEEGAEAGDDGTGTDQ